MVQPANTNGQENCKKALESIGQDLINRAEDISRDLKFVTSITIHAELNPAEIVNYGVSKNYGVYFTENEEEN